MAKPLVAVVGRPNVGKSTFFNKICGKRISIIKDTPGVTRDYIIADAEWCGTEFTLIDTGGIDLRTDDPMGKHILSQARVAIDMADVILFFADAKSGVVSTDYDVANMLRSCGKNVLLAVNKLDNFELEKLYDFYELGLGEPIPISCEQSKGLGDLLDEIVKLLPKADSSQDSAALSIAVVGKPNVGKSSIVNKLLGFKRVIVSDVAGTTRDAIDTPFRYNGKDYVLIDTAGMRRKRSIDDDSVESYSVLRSLAAVKRADVVLVMFDASEELSEQDVKIAGFVHEQGKPCVVVVNKWDKIEKDAYTVNKFNEKISADLAFMNYVKTLFISVQTGQRVEKVIDFAEEAYASASKRIPTGTLNDVVSEAVAMNEPPAFSGRRLKIYYATQAETNPPKFVFFVNDDTLVHFSYRRYLENRLRKAFDFTGTPIKLVFNKKKEDV
ncbi:ribosome biogenesis GTPase Der [Pumilibacter intestinalis]|uniref:ribosome biogenesis GTPase Der n=1 Tax=Pumilibacter intestinalis TaxID=2941511 RepID=UPI00203DAA88|nr:ribosome biogenesis GTPase Der [Pumilibacter intestinalis]